MPQPGQSRPLLSTGSPRQSPQGTIEMQESHAWSGRFSEPVSELVKKYTASIDFDKRLAEFDIEGSLAHATMLNKAGVLSDDDVAAIRRGMAEILDDIRAGRLEWNVA